MARLPRTNLFGRAVNLYSCQELTTEHETIRRPRISLVAQTGKPS